jgi:hypothetical protein
MSRSPNSSLGRALGTAVAFAAALVAATSGPVTADATSGAPHHERSASSVHATERARVNVKLRIPSVVSDQSSVRTVVRLRSSHKLPHGIAVIRVDGKRAGKAVVAGGRRHGRVKVTLRAMPLGAHRVSAAFRANGHLLGKSRPTRVTSRAGCAPQPSACGYPDASNTGVRAGAPMRTINGSVTLSQDGEVLENAIVTGSIDIQADNVVVRNVRITVSGESWAIALRHARNATISNCEITPSSSRLMVGIVDLYGDGAGTTVRGCEIVNTSTGIQIGQGLIEDNYIHDMGYKSGDHINGTTSNGSTSPLTIRHNTIFNQFDQTDAVSLFQDFGLEANRTITDNLLAGGGYTIYGGEGDRGTTYNIKITNNRIARLFFPRGGYWGPVAHFETSGSGNVWSGNVWDDSSAAIRP